MDISNIPLSPIVEHDGLLILSGQLGFTSPGTLIEGGIEAQTAQVLRNIGSVLAQHGSNLSDVIKTTVWLTREEDFADFNAAYARAFEGGNYPARSTVVSKLLIKGALIEIEAIARKPEH